MGQVPKRSFHLSLNPARIVLLEWNSTKLLDIVYLVGITADTSDSKTGFFFTHTSHSKFCGSISCEIELIFFGSLLMPANLGEGDLVVILCWDANPEVSGYPLQGRNLVVRILLHIHSLVT